MSEILKHPMVGAVYHRSTQTDFSFFLYVFLQYEFVFGLSNFKINHASHYKSQIKLSSNSNTTIKEAQEKEKLKVPAITALLFP